MIKIPKVRVIAPDGVQLGVMDTRDALRKANEDYDLDLIEVSPSAKPPVCKIMDYGKYKYQMKKKEQESKKKQTIVLVKEIKMTTKTEAHDLNHKVKKIEKFIADGNKTKVTIRFKGREMANTQLGRVQLEKVLEILGDKISVEQPPKMEGRQMYMILSPKG